MKQLILEFIELLENDARLYREDPNSVVDIKDCIRWTRRAIDDFEEEHNLL